MSVTVRAKNQGPNPSQAGSFVTLRMILSPDQEINQADTLYRDEDVPIAEWVNGATVERTFSYTIPASALGTFYWGAYVDAGDRWQEDTNDNNALRQEESVQVEAGHATIVSNVRAGQRAGTKLVDITYDLATPNGSAVTVGVAVSINGGASYTTLATTSGDVGSGIAPGTGKIVTWDAGADWNGQLSANVRFRVTADGTAAESGIVTVDTLNAPLTVSGRVLHAVTRSPLAGATVVLAGQSRTTSASGDYSFANVSLSSGNTVTVSKGGFIAHTETVAATPGSIVRVVDTLLRPTPAIPKPVVTGVQSDHAGLFLAGVSLPNRYTANVNWNDRTPDVVEFYANGSLVQRVGTTSAEATARIDVGQVFVPALREGVNTLRVVAVDGGGGHSDAYERSVRVIPLPSALIDLVPGFSVQFHDEQVHCALDFDYPDPPLGAPVTLPFLGKFGAELSVNGSFDYTLPDGTWELTLGYSDEFKKGKRGRRPQIPAIARYPKLHFYIGNKTITARLAATLRGTARPASGVTFDELAANASIDADLERGRFGVTDIFMPGSTEALNRVPGLKDVVSTLQAQLTATLGAASTLNFDLRPQLQLRDGELKGRVGVEASYKPRLLGFVDAEFSAGGLVTLTIGVPNGEFKGLHGELYGEAQFHSWFFTWPPESEGLLHAVFARFDIPGQASPSAMFAGGASWRVYRVKGTAVPKASPAGVALMSRAYLGLGSEPFLASASAAKEVGQTGLSPLDSFRLMSQAPVKGSVSARPSRRTKDGDPYSPTNQVDLTLVQNAFPNSQPALAGRSNELMLLWATDNGSSNDLQFTDIRWTRWDGTDWSEAQTVHTNTQAEFAPQVKFDGNGDAIAVWERVADPNFTNVDLAAMAAQMEIVWSRWDRSNGTWTEPAALTANSYLDHGPLLCGPLANGDLLAVWTANWVNLLMGTNGAGGDQVLWSQWEAATRSWTAPQTLLSNVAYRLSESLAGAGGHAVYAWTQDGDDVLTNDVDQEVFYCEWTNGVWSDVKQFTTNSVADKTVRAAVATNGAAYLVWQSGTNLVMSRDFSTNFTVVRADSQTAGFADYTATLGPLGHLVVLWQEMSTTGSDAHCAVYDPASDRWSKDTLLCADPPLERSFAPVWDDVGNLTVAYNKVEMLYTNKTVELEGGGTITITNVPQPGRVDLVVTKRALVKDLALLAGDFAVEGNNYLPGDPLPLSALVRNRGNVAVSNVTVSFFDGDRGGGGTLITNVALPGWLEASGTNLASALWVVPEPADPHSLYAVVDPSDVETENDESNNVQSVSMGGTDLAVSLVSYRAETNGAVRVIAQVQNLGAPTATNSVLAIRRKGETNALLATADVPTLEPGRLAQVALDLPPGAQPEGESLYRLLADETQVVPDVNTNNTTTAFAVNLWIDSDGDGIPDSWMMQFFAHPTGQASDNSLPEDDADHDGLTNLREFQLGLNPTIPDRPYLEALLSPTNNAFALLIRNLFGRSVTMEVSTNLMDWQTLTNLTETNATVHFQDPAATNAGQRFYRAVWTDQFNPPPLGMVLIPAGEFVMGDTFGEGGDSELPLQTNYVSAFYMDQHEVTKVLWEEVYAWAVNQGYGFDYPGLGKATDYPVHTINWYDAVKWCNARSEKEERVPAYYTDSEKTTVYRSGQVNVDNACVGWTTGYRLPTEAEWEKAARGGVSGKRFPWSDTDTINQARANYHSTWDGGVPSYPYDVNPTEGCDPRFATGACPYTSPVGSFAANGYGLYDMAGNVWEWCWDWFGAYSSGSQSDACGPASGSDRVMRSGGWHGGAIGCRAAHRDYYLPNTSDLYFGFRTVRPPDQPLPPANPDPDKMVWIPPGTFTMGSPDTEIDRYPSEGPQREVRLTKGCFMGKYEVTQGEYLELIGSNPSSFTGDLNRPVETVSWGDATNYCVRLTERERLASRLPERYVYRLPTEAEWEYASRAGTTTRFSYGDDQDYTQLESYAWYGNNSSNTTHAVGTKQPNPWGLFDMSGNLFEWCIDWYGMYVGASDTDPEGPASGAYRVIRGGDWYDPASHCRSALRSYCNPAARYDWAGFRVVLAPEQP